MLSLDNCCKDDNETNETKLDSSYLKKSMNALETAILCVLWHKILQRFHSTSKSLHRADMSLGSCVALYNEIGSFFASIYGMNLIQLKRMV